MKYFFLIVFFLISIPYYNFCQIVNKGKPSFYNKGKREIPVIVLPHVNLNKLRKEDNKYAKSKLKSLRFAQMIEVDISHNDKGIWESEPNGDKIWYLKIKSPGAYSISILFDNYRLPVGAKLFVYSADQKHVRGSFTHINNKWNCVLPIAPVMGDEIVLEYHEPVKADFQGELHISSIAHDYKNVFNFLSKSSKGFEGSDVCNVNINCDNDDLWQLLKKSVCKITYNGWLCSGALINNTNQDGHPYLLTANHCINNTYDAIEAIFYFNYESPDCEDIDGIMDQSISGSTIIATPSIKTLDFSLLELSVNPPPSYKPYYAGWNRDVVDPTSVTSIHHPQGDIKKITKSYDGATTGDYGEGYNEYVHWWIEEWDEGTTEGGSSGSPLFDQDGRIIGDLTGGDASCSFNYNDYYQQFYHSWQDFADSSSRLKPWLDPTNSGTITLNGYLPYDTIPSQLKASLVDTLVHLTWNEVIDTANIEYYYIYMNSAKYDSVTLAMYTDTLAFRNILYKYSVTVKYKIPTEFESLPSNSVYVRSTDTITLPFVERFEDKYSIPDNWYEEKSNDTVGWEFKSGGFDGVVDNAFEGSINAFFFNDNGETSKLVLPKFDFSANTNVKLSFYMHMQQFNNDVHNLKILYKEVDSLKWKCIRTYNTSVEKWKKKEISLPNLSSNYQIAFEGIGNRGFGICIDSVSITEDGKFVEPDFTINKDTICLSDSIEFNTALDNSYDLYWIFGDSAIPRDASGAGPHWVKYLSSGIKPVQLIVNDTYIKQGKDAVVVFNLPVAPSFKNIGNELSSSSEMGNQWYFNGVPIDGATENTYIIENDGDYFVEVTNSFNCNSVSASQYMVVSGIEEFIEDENNEGLKIFPNPNRGSFTLQLETIITSDQIKYEIIDITGIVQQSGIIEPYEKTKIIDLDKPKEGIYFIQIYSSDNYFTSKILIKK